MMATSDCGSTPLISAPSYSVDHDFVRAFHHVAVGQNVTVLADNDAGTLGVVNRFATRLPLLSFFELLLEALAQLRHHVKEGIAAIVQVAVVRFVSQLDDYHGGRHFVGDFNKGLVELPRQVHGG